MRLCLVEDHAVIGLEPLTLNRPVFDLLLGGRTLEAKIARAMGVGPGPARRGALVRPHLAPCRRERDPHTVINDEDWLARGPVLVVNARWIPPADFTLPDEGLPWLGLCDGQPACAFVGPEHTAGLGPHNVDAWFEELQSQADCLDQGGEWINHPWDLVAKNETHLIRDFARRRNVGLSNRHLTAIALVGPANRLSIHESACIDPYTVFDTTDGPITIEAGVAVQSFTRIEGPCHVGHDTRLFRANLRGGVTLGPNCRIGGEIEQAIVLGRSNKYHEGFLGHAYVGEWVNLGAITSNSDLRNDYGEVSVPLHGDPISTGMAKVGCFLGDHTRTGMGCMLNTGTAVGLMCNLLPAGRLLPKHVPSFSAVLHGAVAPGFPLEQMFETARTVKGRRGERFTKVEEQLYRVLFEQTRLERERAFQKANDRRGDPWPVFNGRVPL